MENTNIAWCTHTFNPWIGCTKVDELCQFCYAESQMDHRWGKVQWGPRGERVRTSESNWRQPIKYNAAAAKAGERHSVFCASLADVCEDRPELKPWRRDLLDLVYKTASLDWLFLTKRPENYLPMMVESGLYACANPNLPRPQPNIWVGTSVGTQKSTSRIADLLGCPAPIRFLSCEPLLEAVDLKLTKGIDWVIVGCESMGRKAGRFSDGYEAAARSIMHQCRADGVSFFHKQMPINGMVSHDPAEWPEDLRAREFPKVAINDR